MTAANLFVDDFSVDELLRMSDEDFADLVSDDVRGDVVEALRHDDVLDRWWEASTVLYAAILAQLAGRKGDKDAETRHWRYTAMRFQSGLIGRLGECKALRKERNVQRHEAQNLGNRAAKKAARAQRVVAHEAAISRLMEAHREEYERYRSEADEALS